MFSDFRSPSLIAQAPAKVNLFLRVVAKRPDGYHNIETVMARLSGLADTLAFDLRADDRIELHAKFAFPTTLPAQPWPPSEANLVVRAARLLQQTTGCQLGARITLLKRIPASAGLGGGSSDAATTLASLNRLWKLNLAREELLELAGKLGSDVPFFLADSASVLCTGRGEVLSPLASLPPLWMVLARPASGLSTPAVYRACQPEGMNSDAARLLEDWGKLPVRSLARRLQNSLQRAAEELNPEVARLRELFERQGVKTHQMTGSGSAYFGVCSSARQACWIARRLRCLGVPWVWTATTAV